jgi:hypothetical protein
MTNAEKPTSDNDIPDIVNRYSNSRQKATDYALKVLVPFG